MNTRQPANSTADMYNVLRFTHLLAYLLPHLLLAACGTRPLVVPAPGVLAPNFTLKDQYDTEFRLNQFRGESVLLLGCDKDSMNQAGTWFNVFLEKYPDSLRILPIANGSDLPFVMRLFVKGKIKDELRGSDDDPNPRSILLDWDGKVSRQYGMPAKMCTVVLIDQSGRIEVVQSFEQTSEHVLESVLDRIDEYIR